MDIIKQFASLPPWIYFEGVTFELRMFNNGNDDIRIVYAILMCDDKSKHKKQIDSGGFWSNPFRKGSLTGFLYLHENIENDLDFIFAIDDCKKFLKKNKLK